MTTDTQIKMHTDREIPDQALTFEIIGVFYDVYSDLSVYLRLITIEYHFLN